MRVNQCPSGYTMSRNDLYPTDDNCVECKVDEYLSSPITIQNKSIVCQKCPVGAICPGITICLCNYYSSDYAISQRRICRNC
jgi:hypothetical protein